MRDGFKTKTYYQSLGFELMSDYGNYLIFQRAGLEIHFFEFKDLNPDENYGQIYIRINSIDQLYQEYLERAIAIHPNGSLQDKPWGQREFSLLDPDNNLLTFGAPVHL
ncbi:VOC family protein [Algoriphagus sp.]|uniref:bleomycin resistance protein n=1 Tax=Algoriphagus sp. TaxID=1872435 RepID=UPI00261ADEBD|nr:VOC family protein [Algoriphagus sp.]